MKKWSARVSRAAALVVASGSVVVAVSGPARADTYTDLAIKQVGEMVVDGKHQRVIVSDPFSNRIVKATYAGTVDGVRLGGYPGVQGLLLSADDTRLYAAWPGGNAIVVLDPVDLTEITRYDVGSAVNPYTLAEAGGRIWFGYETGTDKGGIGSLDLRGDSPKVTLDDGAEGWAGAPQLATATGRPGMLAASGPLSWEGELAVYDVTGDAPVRTAKTQVTTPKDITLTTDGATLLSAGPGGNKIMLRRTSDLADTFQYPVEYYANAVDVAADGTIAAGSDSSYEPDVHIFTADGTRIRQYELPDTGVNSAYSDTLVAGALAWEPGGDQLFGVAVSDQGSYHLTRFTSPKKSPPTATLTGPASAKRATALTLTGSLTASLPLPAGTSLSVTRTDPESPAGRALGTVTTAADGTFTVKDTPQAGSKVTYQVAFAGDATHEPAGATWSVDVSRNTPTLTLNRKNNTIYAYGVKVPFTAHLAGAYSGRTVEIWADPYGSDQPNKLIRKAAVDSKGNLTATLTLTRNTKVTAVYRGDSRTAPRTVAATVLTNVKVSQSVKGHYKTAKIGGTKYYYFHAKKNPQFTTTMTYYKGRAQLVSIEYYAKGKWRSWGWGWVKLASNGKSTVTVVGTHDKNIKMRVHASYVSGQYNSGDTLNHSTNSAWTYFIFTK